MITFSIIQKSQLEGAYRLDAEYYQLGYLEDMEISNLKKVNNIKKSAKRLTRRISKKI